MVDPATAPATLTRERPWYELPGEQAAVRLSVDPAAGLSPAQAAERLAAHGPNRLREPAKRPVWLRVADQFRSLLIAVLAAAALLAGLVGDLKDALVITVVLVLNAAIGFAQEYRAERSLEALRRMLVATARVRRAGAAVTVPAHDLVPGDLVLLEAGDRVPADGRLLVAERLEVDESALTGESLPVTKSSEPLEAGGADLPLGDRRNLAFANTTVTRGRAELLVTATGMDTAIGAVAGLLAATPEAPTPLQRQLDGLGRRLALVAVAAVGVYAVLGLLQGETVADLALTAIALAVAAIPEGLPAVLALTLALGMQAMARQGAITKRMVSVETLGATTVLCTDKTGTLTLNRMTVRAVAAPGRRHTLPGPDAAGEPGRNGRAPLPLPAALLETVALCNDAEVGAAGAVGDPMEVALVVLAGQGGVDPAALRRRLPRTTEIPFDAERRWMATFHRDGDRVRVAVKGAPDALLGFCSTAAAPDGPVALDAAAVHADLDTLARQGLRVLAAASGSLPVSAFDPEDPERRLRELTFEGLIGIADPPRPEARGAIAVCRRAGIDVKMITGDHAATASAIAAEVGIEGTVLTGADLDALPREEVPARVAAAGVIARVTPEHKLRIVQALQGRGEVVAMTGDGVNDGPALKVADIGVAMGTTGTEVAKEAASMVLTDDNIRTIVGAVERGRSIYANILAFLRFQLSTNIGAILTLLGAQLLGLPAPFTAVQILWVNLIADGPPALALGVEPPRPGLMDDQPRRPGTAVLTGRRLLHLGFLGTVMAVGTLGVLSWALERLPTAQAMTLAFTTFVLFQLVNAFNARHERRSALVRGVFTNRTLWLALGAVAVLQVAVVQLGPLRALLDTAPLEPALWAVAVGVALTVLAAEETRKAIVRARRKEHHAVSD